MVPTRITDPRLRNWAWAIFGICSVLFIAAKVARTFFESVNPLVPGFGTASAPFSDPLLWLQGGLSILFQIKPSALLYRPTIGLFWGAILAATGRAEGIPLFFVLWLFAFVLGTLVLLRDVALRAALILWLAISAVIFQQTWGNLLIPTAGVDFPAFVITLSGLVLLLMGWEGRRAPVVVILAGSLCLGIAAAVRGPMLLGGTIMIIARILATPRMGMRYIFLAGLFFAAPLATDVALQQHWGIVNNGVMGLYCVFSDPTHSWTPSCGKEFLVQMPSTYDVLVGYGTFLLSPEGIDHVAFEGAKRIAKDIGALITPVAMALLIFGGLLTGVAVTESRGSGKPLRSRKFRLVEQLRNPSPLTKSVAMVSAVALAQRIGGDPWSTVVLLVVGILVALKWHAWRAALCLGGYMGGVAFLSLTGLTAFERFAATFSFTLYLGLALLITESRRLPKDKKQEATNGLTRLASCVIAAVAFLYIGSHILPSNLRSAYLRDVQGKDAAIKLSDDAQLDRSLYCVTNASREWYLIYTRHDSLPLGTVRNYRALTSNTTFNDSFMAPNSFVD